MVISNRPLHAFFSGVFAVLILNSTAAAQDKPSGAPSRACATALSILNLFPPARPTPEKTNGAHDDLRPNESRYRRAVANIGLSARTLFKKWGLDYIS